MYSEFLLIFAFVDFQVMFNDVHILDAIKHFFNLGLKFRNVSNRESE